MKIVAALLALLAGGLGYVAWQEHRGRLVAEQRTVAAPTPVAPAPVPEETEPEKVAAAPKAGSAKLPLPTEYLRIIDETRASLEAVRKELSAAKNETAAAAARWTEEREQREKLVAELAETQEALASAKRVSAATETELKAKADRLVKLETSEKLVREAAGKAEVNSAKVLRTAEELEGINRKREVLLASLIRRYRDVTDQYRTLSLRVQSRAEQLGLDPGAGELSRIQTSVQQAEDEMRQLNGLNAQAAKLLRGGR